MMEQPTASPTLRWLHITDLHIGKSDQSQASALRELLGAISKFSNNKSFDLVLFTGDLSYSGQAEEYDSLYRLLVEPLRAHELCKNATFIAVPGNHDLNCQVELPIHWKVLGPKRQEKFFHFDSIGVATRGSRARAFEAYRDFVKRSGIESVDPTLEPARSISILGKDKPITVVSTVTSYFSDYESSDFQLSPAPLHAIRTLVDNVDPNALILVLGHHPIDWFLPEWDRRFHSFLVEKRALYLHGHLHKIGSRFGAHGLISLGFGAAYPSSIDSSVSDYKNSFAICEITDSLHICPISWDAAHGLWRPEQSVPGDFIDESDQLHHAYKLSLPTTRITDLNARSYAAIATTVRNEVQMERCIWLTTSEPSRWTKLLTSIGYLRGVIETYSLPNKALPVGHIQFRVRDQQGMHLVYAVTGHGDVLNYEQLQSINTELDRQDYDRCLVITLGELSGDARTLATQLSSRKSLVVAERHEVVKRSLKSIPHGLERSSLEAIAANLATGWLVITDIGYAILLQESTNNSWFQVLGEDGSVLPESSSMVHSLRSELLALRTVRYEESPLLKLNHELPLVAVDSFNRREYLEKSYKYFDAVKYAPLAALGMKFRKTSLSEIYVPASAGVGGNSKTSENLTNAVSEFVDSLDLPQSQREQIESQLRSGYGLNRTAEVGAAQKLYQRFNNVIVLGDPGSGKTCFVQHEILAYSNQLDQQDWYSKHLPVYVSLAEAARLLSEETDLLAVCEIVSSRRSIVLPRHVIEAALSEGRAAFFFDGLDEVGYLERRIELLSEIDKLIKKFAHSGCRFVVTSRPAAVQPVDIPEEFTYLNLKGLTEEEIRTLAGRVLTSRLGEGEEKALEAEESELVDRLLDDTRNNIGIARIARNPLLLTLLVLIYANTGALSAKRHLIYTQAIKTLVSVRGRQTREQQISEADLRTRLGALALAIFQRKIAEIPSRKEVVSVISPIMPAKIYSDSVRTSDELASSFLQEVAEATGLLSIHSRDNQESDDLITFMHYSFLEYYAAAGLLSNDYMHTVPELSGNPRWRDVITLLFGVLSEQSDITPLIRKVLSDESANETVSQHKTLLALDCASECDIPPESSQDLLAVAIYRTLSKGAGRYSPSLRSELAVKLEVHLQEIGSRIGDAIAQGLLDADHIVVAAFADTIARLSDELVVSAEIVRSFEKALELDHPVTREALLYAIERRSELRSDSARSVVKESLKGSLIEKDAALKVIIAVPLWHNEVQGELEKLLDDANPTIAASAAKCLLINKLQSNQWAEDIAGLAKVLAILSQSAGRDFGSSIQGVTLDPAEIEQLILSDNENESELAIRHVPLIRDNDQFSYMLLIKCFRTSDLPRIKAACLDSLRSSSGAIKLITISDTDYICDHLTAEQRSVRIAAIRLLGDLPDDEQVIMSLKDYLEVAAKDVSRESEVTETAKALAKHVRRNQRLRSQILNTIVEKLPKKSKNGFGSEARQRHVLALLEVCESMIGVNDNLTAWSLHGYAVDFRTPIEIRKQALVVFGKIVEPSPQSIDALLKLLQKNDMRMNESVYSATSSFVSQCRRKMDYVRSISTSLRLLQSVLYSAWSRETALQSEIINSSSIGDIRSAVVDIGNLIVAYDEFSERTKILRENA